MPDKKYQMSISLNVLNHLGLHLYSNTPAVLSEVIANAWDADATLVKINFSKQAITVADNGVGMDLDDINNKYLLVGYEKRPKLKKGEKPRLTPIQKRPPMGRKGIGKLSLFSIAKKIAVYSRKAGEDGESFLMDAEKIQAAIAGEGLPKGKQAGINPSDAKPYEPEPIHFDGMIDGAGTVIRIEDLKRSMSVTTAEGLRKRISRRFGILGEKHDFAVFVNDKEVTFADRDYFHKARFLFQYGAYDYSQYCKNLDNDDERGKAAYARTFRFDEDGNADKNGAYSISGWIGIARHSNDLDDKREAEEDNLNKITIVVRGKVAKEDVLQDYRLGGMITKYIYGEINADFLDDDGEKDIATSSRQSIIEDDPRYIALKKFLDKELRHIWNETNKLKDKKGLEAALAANPHIRGWYEGLRPRALQQHARKLFGSIDKISVDEGHKKDLYANGILAFEHLKMSTAMEKFEQMAESADADKFLAFLSDIDAIEAAHYGEIVRERLRIIRALRDKVNENSKERVLQEHVFDHLWLLDPGWERATKNAEMETVLRAVDEDSKQGEIVGRADITYRACSGGHIILELKKPDVSLSKTQIEDQLKKYIRAIKDKQDSQNESAPIHAFCLIGKAVQGWGNPAYKADDIKSLSAYNISILTYDELVFRAEQAYNKYLEKSAKVDTLRMLIEKIRAYESPQKGDA